MPTSAARRNGCAARRPLAWRRPPGGPAWRAERRQSAGEGAWVATTPGPWWNPPARDYDQFHVLESPASPWRGRRQARNPASAPPRVGRIPRFGDLTTRREPYHAARSLKKRQGRL